MISLIVNGKNHHLDLDAAMPLLWVIRDVLALTGTKFGCGIAQCGACTIHLNSEAIRSCVTPVSEAAGKKITTIEGLTGQIGKRLQMAWAQEDVPQCGYCQSGQIMSAAVLLREKPNPSDLDIDESMSGNLCRCGTYQRIRKAIHSAAAQEKSGNK